MADKRSFSWKAYVYGLLTPAVAGLVVTVIGSIVVAIVGRKQMGDGE